MTKSLLDTLLAINPVGPNFGHGPPWPLATTRGHQISSAKPSPQLKGNSFLSFMHSVPKIAGVVHIWYYIPLCTIFAQQSNGDVFRTQFHLSISRSIIPTPISKEDFSAHQSGNPWRQFRRSFKDPNHLYLQELGWYNSFRIILRSILKRYYII
ncbi:hypothetical protein O181_023361 [Austropuccinia psidii MF-1]|uniref:Uncharacterized protein n=1 Tax=Austropuccinia psidii MF-1 TaxID=1389203 RepID=A0A9Q3CEM6_9BASI|nr:hypothetical protein [Austropuccinia psidii MF-1]